MRLANASAEGAEDEVFCCAREVPDTISTATARMRTRIFMIWISLCYRSNFWTVGNERSPKRAIERKASAEAISIGDWPLSIRSIQAGWQCNWVGASED